MEQYYGITTKIFTPEKIRAVRLAYRLTQEKFAKILDISVYTLRNWEQGRFHPCGSACTLLDIADKYSEVIFKRKKLTTIEEISKEFKLLFKDVSH